MLYKSFLDMFYKAVKVIFVSALIFQAGIKVHAKVELPPIFVDNMVLQQQSEAAIWGKAEPNAKIIVTTTWSKKRTVVKSDSDGKWFTRISTPVAGGPYEITFNDGDKVTIRNILIGEVWICSGQSNMAHRMKGNPGQPIKGAAELIVGANPKTPIRSCNLERVIHMEPQDECPANWYEHTPEGVSQASAIAYFFARKLYETLGVPVGVINASWGGTIIEAWMNPQLLKEEFGEELDLKYLLAKTWPEKGRKYVPGVIYNGMLHSLVPYTAKGFLWYQGCANRKRPEQYRKLQPAFVRMLRQEWDNDKMPFYFAQIAPYQYNGPEETEGAFIRWSQAQTLAEIPYSGMATTLDVGELTCIHPANKKKVADRLAYLALTNDYGISCIDANAPMPKEFIFKDGAAYVSFHCGSMGVGPTNVELKGFELAGEDKVFYPATAIVQKDSKSVKVTSSEVPVPVAVRYGMRNWSEATLFNNFGIPASAFRSDDWQD